MRTFKWCIGAAIALATASAHAQTQEYPNRVVRFIVGFAPGGGTDIVARLLAQKLSESLGQQFVVENRPGATGMVGANAVAKAAPDGYTLLMAHVNSNAIAPTIAKKPLYDPVRDFALISYVGYVPNILVINAQRPFKSVADLVAAAKSSPKGLTFASPGVGSTNHLAGEMLAMGAGVKLVHVPYKGSSPAIVDLLGGQIDMNFDALSSVVPYLKDGRMRALAVTTPQRDPEYPDVPTMTESGFKQFEVTNWYGVAAPAGTPPAIVDRLNKEINRIVQEPEVVKKLDELGVRRNPMTPAQFQQFVEAEIAKYRTVAQATGISTD
ncbi:tripartite tricarboxylate transporter substrate binding protein [Pigmentiphaga soli]|uniref:Tripartite tricarboxylate transporter substrate binding protein n=1 Tax=Pigmentiphaga soli TaxID=1007095 RepID=A0ABP8GDG2_9BURK